jgi:hypothetical protein
MIDGIKSGFVIKRNKFEIQVIINESQSGKQFLNETSSRHTSNKAGPARGS